MRASAKRVPPSQAPGSIGPLGKRAGSGDTVHDGGQVRQADVLSEICVKIIPDEQGLAPVAAFAWHNFLASGEMGNQTLR